MSKLWPGLVPMSLILVISGCAVRPAVPLSPQDPASSSAPESSVEMAPALLKASDSDRIGLQGMAPGQPDMGEMDHGDHQPNRIPMPPDMNMDPQESYVCPMHPEVKSSQPGSCPICHMELAKKKPEPPVPGDVE